MLILAAIFAVFVYGLIAPVLGALLPSYSLTSGQEAALALSYAIGLIVATLIAGPMIDIKGNKIALIFGLALVSASLFAAPNAGAYGGLLTVYVVMGLGGGIVVTGANALAGAVDPSRRGSALNFLNLFFGLGGIVTTYAASNVLRPVTLCYSIATLTVVALIINALAKTPPPSGELGFQLSEVPVLLSKPALILLSLFLFLYVSCEIGIWNWLQSYLISLNFTPKRAGSVVSYGFAFGILVGRVVVSRILVKVPAITVTFAAAILMAITTFTMLQLHSAGAITIAVFCAGLSMAPVFPTTLAMVGDAFPRGTATAMCIAITLGWVGLAVSSPIIGKVKTDSNLSHALLLLPIFSVLMVLVNVVLRPVLKRRHEVLLAATAS